MQSSMTTRVRSSSPSRRRLAWILLFASLSATGQSEIPPPFPPASLPVISPPVPKSGILPFLMRGENRFFTDADKLKTYLEKAEKPQAKLEDFRIETEQARVRLEQERRNHKITKESYSKDMDSYGESIKLYRDLKKQY